MPSPTPDPKHPVLGALAIDASDVQIVYLTPDQIKHVTKVRPGFDGALACVAQLTPAQAQILGVPATDLAEIQALQPTLDRLDEIEPPAEEMARLIRTTRLARQHRSATLIHAAVQAAQLRARHDPNAAEILGVLKDAQDYVSAPAGKAVLTKTKKGQLKSKSPKSPPAGAAPAQGAQGTPPPAPKPPASPTGG
jgi:hypothetical protein